MGSCKVMFSGFISRLLFELIQITTSSLLPTSCSVGKHNRLLVVSTSAMAMYNSIGITAIIDMLYNDNVANAALMIMV